ncbi:TNF receptor-associated factor 6 [Chamberlinius hualienensis]
MASCEKENSDEEVSKSLQASVADSTQQPAIQGYDYEFVPPLDGKYECAICLMCQKDPIQTTCGHRFCRACILTWISNKSRVCPEDNCPLAEHDVFPDNFAKREIANLKAKCPNSKNGCQAVVELRAMEEHQRHCEHEMISCPNGCPVAILQQDMAEHVNKECLHRLIECSLCCAHFHLNQQQSHFETCPKVSIPCRNCGENVLRQDHQKHLRYECPKSLTYSVQSSIKSTRDALENLSLQQNPTSQPDNKLGTERKTSVSDTHLKELFQRYVQLEQRNREQELKCCTLSQRLAEVETEAAFLREKLSSSEGRFCNGVYVWRVQGISELVAQALNSVSGQSKHLHSPGFYTGAFGYKVCLRLNITLRQTAYFLSIFIHFLQGDYDDTLEWPFTGQIILALVESSREDNQVNHIVETMTTKPGLSAFQRPTTERNPKGFGYAEFVSMDVVNRGFYLKNDALTVRAIVAVESKVQCD